jgi:2'-5' RNA ligase
MVRCFIAIYPIKSEKIYKLQQEIGKLIEGKEVEKENMHITLSFLGEINDKEVEKIKKKLKEIAEVTYKRNITLGKIKFIPSENFFRVIAIDIIGLDDIVELIKKEIGGDVKPPHLTLFRVKRVKDKSSLLEASKKEIREEIFVERICLVKSTLTPKGPIYEIIESFELRSH